MKKFNPLVLGALLILIGLAGLFVGIDGQLIIAILAVAAGVLILISRPGVSRKIGWTLAGVYLVAKGLLHILPVSFDGIGLIMAILALAAGVLLVTAMRKLRGNIGYVLFFAWLILVGLIGLLGLGQLGQVVDILALAAGLLLILKA